MLTSVKASAGSGKTYKLTQEFLQRLSGALAESAPGACGQQRQNHPHHWTEILAVTFTNKAAAEMQQRILGALKKRALELDTAGQVPDAIAPRDAARWVERILRRLGELNVRTIDSLLHQILRLGALQLHYAPDLELEFESKKLCAPLYAGALSAAEQGDELQGRLLDQALDALFRIRGCSRFLPKGAFDELLEEVFDFLIAQPGLELGDDPAPLERQLLARTVWLQETAATMAAHLEAQRLAGTKHFLTFLARCGDQNPYGDLPSPTFARKPSLAACLLKQSQAAVTPEGERLYVALCAAYEALAREAPPLRSSMTMAPLVRFCKQLLTALPPLLRRDGLAPAAWLPHAAAELLAGPCCSEALCRMGNRLAHLLLDEFQDTSRAQWQALESLAEQSLSTGGSLFYVGDVKQAIYGWRGGDAALFDEVPRSLAHLAPPRSENLETNWRSSGDLVDFNNAFFSRLAQPEVVRAVAQAMLGDKAPPQEQERFAALLQAAYADVVQQVAPRNRELRGFVHLEELHADGKEELHAAVEERLEGILRTELGLGSAAPLARCRDVAILVRSNDQAALVARWCLQWGLPVVTENSLLLQEHPLVRQMVALLRWLDTPDNDLALFEAVSGPELFAEAWGDELDAHGLHAWLCAQGNGPRRNPPPLFLSFRERFPQFWQRALEPLHRHAGFMSAYDIFCDMVARFRLLERHTQDALYIRRLLETAHVAESRGALSPAAFLDTWAESGGEQKVPLPENLDALRVLTMHKAKGLEFPLVIVPFHHSDKPSGRELCTWQPAPDAPPVLTTLHPGLGDLYYAQALPQLLEQVNLLYVAWTRAVRGLYCLITSTDYYQGHSPLLRALGVLLPPLGLVPGGDPLHRGVQPEELGLQQDTDVLPHPQALPLAPAGEQPMQWLPRLSIFRSELREENFVGRMRGTLAHRCLELLGSGEDAEADVRRALHAGLRGFSDPHDPAAFAEDNPRLEEELRGMLLWVRRHPELATLLRSGSGEQELLRPEGGVLRVDYLARRPDGGLTAIEYKTGAPEPQHRTQLGRYLELLAGLPRPLHVPPPQGLLVYLDTRDIQRLEV